MLLLIGFSAALVIGVILLLTTYLEGFPFLLIFGGGMCLAITLICGTINYSETKAEVERYHALKTTIEVARNGDISEIERAALTTEIAEYNKDLASVKYWNKTTFDIFIADELAELKPLN